MYLRLYKKYFLSKKDRACPNTGTLIAINPNYRYVCVKNSSVNHDEY